MKKTNLTTTVMAAALALNSATAAFADSDEYQAENFRTGVILEMDCGDFSNERRVNFCIKSSAWEMQSAAYSVRDAIRESGLGLGQTTGITLGINDNCDPRTHFRNMSETPQTLSAFKEATMDVIEACDIAVRDAISGANESLEIDGQEPLNVNTSRLSFLRNHAQWLSGLDLSEFDVEPKDQDAAAQDGPFVIQLP